MLETTLVALQDVSLDKIFDEAGRKALCNVVPQVMLQVIFVGKLYPEQRMDNLTLLLSVTF